MSQSRDRATQDAADTPHPTVPAHCDDAPATPVRDRAMPLPDDASQPPYSLSTILASPPVFEREPEWLSEARGQATPPRALRLVPPLSTPRQRTSAPTRSAVPEQLRRYLSRAWTVLWWFGWGMYVGSSLSSGRATRRSRTARWMQRGSDSSEQVKQDAHRVDSRNSHRDGHP